MSDFEVKGWCPGALRPMMSGDGLVVRVRPRAGRITAAQAIGIAQAARLFGSGIIDLSSRANLQLRGVRPESHDALLIAFDALGLLDADPRTEARRNIVVTPFWDASHTEAALASALERALSASDLVLPGKFGFAIDCGSERLLADVPADIRIERGNDHTLIVRADGAPLGVPVEPSNAVSVALALAHWFLDSGGVSQGRGRMAAHIQSGARVPEGLQGTVEPVARSRHPAPGLTPAGALVAIAFGSMHADTLEELGRYSPELRLTPWRMIFLPAATQLPAGLELVTRGDDPVLRVEACPGAPLCPQARAETRSLALELARHVPDHALLHVSGCAKGCACTRAATRTLIATPHGFDLVCNGTTSSVPVATGLTAAELKAEPARYLGEL